MGQRPEDDIPDFSNLSEEAADFIRLVGSNEIEEFRYSITDVDVLIKEYGLNDEFEDIVDALKFLGALKDE